ncbi:hypothetical protein DPMN_017541 [Dreissena polymorpha]|uniref:Uncharacterized protein n=1 Tax=Dreissena polymorpha TaxID=45954 RepID=A0A9D4NGP5_DREPO|nr:hypothetical protein DPMN_017541 [Dreissena polymorpha]
MQDHRAQTAVRRVACARNDETKTPSTWKSGVVTSENNSATVKGLHINLGVSVNISRQRKNCLNPTLLPD